MTNIIGEGVEFSDMVSRGKGEEEDDFHGELRKRNLTYRFKKAGRYILQYNIQISGRRLDKPVVG